MKNIGKEPVLSENDVKKAYKDALRAVGTAKGLASDETRQFMADAVRQFYHLLEERIESRRADSASRNAS